jgi:hypothetical protein
VLRIKHVLFHESYFTFSLELHQSLQYFPKLRNSFGVIVSFDFPQVSLSPKRTCQDGGDPMSSARNIVSAISEVNSANSTLVADATSTLTKVSSDNHTTKLKGSCKLEDAPEIYLSSSDNQASDIYQDEFRRVQIWLASSCQALDYDAPFLQEEKIGMNER